MVAWINLAVLVFSSLGFLLFYVRSVSPAGLEKIKPGNAYPLCYRLRMAAILFELITFISYVVTTRLPLPLLIPGHFPWAWWISALLGTLIGVPALILMGLGMRDAGIESLRPQKEQGLFTGIYLKVRHPQAAGEVFLWLVLALFLDSPFLAGYAMVFFPIFLVMCWAEEQDLLLRHGELYAGYCRRTGAFWPKRTLKNA